MNWNSGTGVPPVAAQPPVANQSRAAGGRIARSTSSAFPRGAAGTTCPPSGLVLSIDAELRFNAGGGSAADRRDALSHCSSVPIIPQCWRSCRRADRRDALSHYSSVPIIPQCRRSSEGGQAGRAVPLFLCADRLRIHRGLPLGATLRSGVSPPLALHRVRRPSRSTRRPDLLAQRMNDVTCPGTGEGR
jgi:hypothetical protein